MIALVSKLKTYLLAAGAFLLTVFMYKHEKKKRVQAERDRDTANANVDLLERREEIITDLDILREQDNEKSAEMFEKQAGQLERLKHEDDNDIVVGGLMQLLDEPDNKD